MSSEARAWLDEHGIFCVAKDATMHPKQCKYERSKELCSECGYYINRKAKQKPKVRFGSYGYGKRKGL